MQVLEKGNCKHGEDCKYQHPPKSAGAPATNTDGEGANASAKPKAKANAKAGPKKPSYCFKFAGPQGCTDKDCQFMHLTEDMVAEYKRSQAVLRKLHEKKP